MPFPYRISKSFCIFSAAAALLYGVPAFANSYVPDFSELSEFAIRSIGYAQPNAAHRGSPIPHSEGSFTPPHPSVPKNMEAPERIAVVKREKAEGTLGHYSVPPDGMGEAIIARGGEIKSFPSMKVETGLPSRRNNSSPVHFEHSVLSLEVNGRIENLSDAGFDEMASVPERSDNTAHLLSWSALGFVLFSRRFLEPRREKTRSKESR